MNRILRIETKVKISACKTFYAFITVRLSEDNEKEEKLYFRMYSLKRDNHLSNLIKIPEGYNEYL